MKKRCPIYGYTCKDEECVWWRDYANMCAIALIADVLMDSDINNNTFRGEQE